jgi:hypothetical protein
MTVKQPLSELLVETIDTARAHGGELVRLPMHRGCWTNRAAVPSGNGWPAWRVSDNSIHALIRRDIAVVTHTRDGGRPAVVRVRSEAEMAEQKAIPLTIIVDGISFLGFTAPDPVSARKLYDAICCRQDGSEVIKFRATDAGAELSLTVDDAEAA